MFTFDPAWSSGSWKIERERGRNYSSPQVGSPGRSDVNSR